MTDLAYDSQSMLRIAQPLVVEARYCDALGGVGAWQPQWNASVHRIEINLADKPSSALIQFPGIRWNDPLPIGFGWQVRIRTDQPVRPNGQPVQGYGARSILFWGFATGYRPSFTGSTANSPAAEEVAVECRDFRWLVAATSPVFGQFARSVDQISANAGTFFSGRPLIFNADGKPDKDPVDLIFQGDLTTAYKPLTMPIFKEGPTAEYWTCRDMLSYLLTPYINRASALFPILRADCIGLDHSDWDQVINSFSGEGMDLVCLIAKICRNIGWTWREDYSETAVQWIFFKPGTAASAVRSAAQPTILHTLHAPDVNDRIDIAVASGAKMLREANFARDIAGIINNPWGLGDIQRFEFTVELVPAWKDSDFMLDSVDGYANLFKTDADLAYEPDPNQYDYFKYYHTRGSHFSRDLGRKWALNETGRYSGGIYDRGEVFDFSKVIPSEYIKSATGSRLYGPFSRHFDRCLTFDKDSVNSLGIVVEFSFDGGSTWQVLPVTLENLPGECGIRITNPNLAELTDNNKGVIADGDLTGKELNYYSSLADDKINSRSFKAGGWKTRCRVTATVAMDNRLLKVSRPSSGSGSPFYQASIFSMTDRYTFSHRTPQSRFYGTGLPAWNTDESEKLHHHIDAIRVANEDASINGRFTLDRLWAGDGSGTPTFALGDGIAGLSGRTLSFAQTNSGRTTYPEIIQIVYLPVQQTQQIITRDLRLAEVV
ncbi:hypothetical protein ACQ9LF_06315 [Anaerohalosphaeraceae bacterium U12dextr]|jgi:hypothetical protein